MTPKCFVYGLVDPRSDLVFYVGQTRVGVDRPQQHGQAKALKKKSAKTSLIRDLHGLGLRYAIVVLEHISDPAEPAPWVCWWNAKRNSTALHEAERWWIAYGHACSWPLLNETEGGQSGGANKGRTFSAETRARMSAAAIGKKRWPNGRVFTDEHKANMSAAHRGKRHWPNGRTFTDEHRARMRAAKLGKKRKPHTEETKAKMRAAQGRLRSQHSAAMKATWAARRERASVAETLRQLALAL